MTDAERMRLERPGVAAAVAAAVFIASIGLGAAAFFALIAAVRLLCWLAG